MNDHNEVLREAALYSCEKLLISADENQAMKLVEISEKAKFANKEEMVRLAETISEIKRELAAKR